MLCAHTCLYIYSQAGTITEDIVLQHFFTELLCSDTSVDMSSNMTHNSMHCIYPAYVRPQQELGGGGDVT